MPENFCVLVRPLRGGDSVPFVGDDPIAALLAAFEVIPEEEAIAYWSGMDRMCAVDFDLDGDQRVDDARLLVLLENFQPVPSLAWTTHGNGVRLIYVAQDEFKAEEIAAVAMLNLADRLTSSGMELKHDTRHPRTVDLKGRSGGTVVRRVQEFDRRSLRRRLHVYQHDDCESMDWMERNGFEVGGRYDHDRCPVAPSAHGGRRPVQVGDFGITCYVCAAAGVSAGSSTPGFFPYSYLCGTTRTGPLYRMLENATHWGHACTLISDMLGLSPQHSKLVYAAGIALFRGRADADRAFAVGENLLRMGDRWVNVNGEPYVKDIRPLLSMLPACCFRDIEGKNHIDRAKVVAFEQTHDLSRYGYPSLVPIFGMRMRREDHTVRDTVVIQRRELSDERLASFKPVYLEPSKRSSLESAWAQVERCFPGICHEWLLLLIAARGVAEGEDSMPPMVFVTGPTGAGKTSVIHLAASVCGDGCREVVWNENSDRMRQAVIDAASTGTYVAFNEVIKEARRQIKNPNQAMDYMLNLTPDSVSHYMYIGPVRLGRLPVFVWTDTQIPEAIRRDAQIARRLVHAHLPRQIDWDETLARTGVGKPKNFRISDQVRADACNTLVSHVIDEYLSPPKTFEEIACSLGFARLIDSGEAEEGRDALRALFEAVCNAPPLTGSDAIRWKGDGWKCFQLDAESTLRNAWLEVADEDDRTKSRAAGEVDWKKTANLEEAARLETRVHGGKIAVRFRSVAGNRTDYRVNDALRKSKGDVVI